MMRIASLFFLSIVLLTGCSFFQWFGWGHDDEQTSASISSAINVRSASSFSFTSSSSFPFSTVVTSSVQSVVSSSEPTSGPKPMTQENIRLESDVYTWLAQANAVINHFRYEDLKRKNLPFPVSSPKSEYQNDLRSFHEYTNHLDTSLVPYSIGLDIERTVQLIDEANSLLDDALTEDELNNMRKLLTEFTTIQNRVNNHLSSIRYY